MVGNIESGTGGAYLSDRGVERLFAQVDVRLGRARERGKALRLSALLELLYGSGLRATELVTLDVRAIVGDRAFVILRGKGGRDEPPIGRPPRLTGPAGGTTSGGPNPYGGISSVG